MKPAVNSSTSLNSNLYTEPFYFSSGEIKACAFDNDQQGSITTEIVGIVKNKWKLIKTDSKIAGNSGEKAFDGETGTWWQSDEKGTNHFISIDLGEVHELKGFAYTPQAKHSDGMIQEGVIKVSSNGKKWQESEGFEFGNLINENHVRSCIFIPVRNV